MPLEIERAKPGAADEFWALHDRAWRTELWEFRVVWHEQLHDLIAREDDRIVAALRLRIAASLAAIEALYVVPQRRRNGIGGLLVSHAEELANYYNCHKMTAAVFNERPAHAFLRACGYKLDAVLAQHTFKLDVAVLRKFLL